MILGTHNRGKARELRELLVPQGVQVQTLADYADAIEVVEDGTTFAENACKKASGQAEHLSAWVLGEDSGLSVDALDGRPGVFSARYASENATDEDNIQKLLEELAGVPLEKRTAHYTCHMAISDPTGRIHWESAGICRGRIQFAPRGTNGFGYDPVFEIVEYHRTFGELGPAVKQTLSHRGRALRELVRQGVAPLIGR